MTDPADFDAFYREVRERLLVQTYALTGDRAASRSAVRDAFVAAWHHWSRVTRSADREAAVREIAWGKAQRRHGARPWHRDKDVDAATRSTLDALATLGGQQRRVLVLAHLAAVSMPDLAREVGLTVPATERQLQQATAAFVLALGVPAAGVNAALEPLTAVTEQTTWPRGSIVRRTGVARRRAHTLVGVVGVVAALVLSGLFVSDPSGLRPTLAQAVEGVGVVPSDQPGTDGGVATDSAGEPAELLPRSTLLAAPEVARALPGSGWTVASTSDNSEGNGLVLPCQVERYVDPGGEAALVRAFRADQGDAPVRPGAVQLTEVSSSPAAAGRAMRTLTGWVGACTDAEPRTQLVASRSVEGVGDEAVQLVLRDWQAPVTTSVVQVARTGAVLTATATTLAGVTEPAAAATAGLQAAAVDGVCEVRGAGPCARTPRVADASPPTTRGAPAMISEIDLPPVSGVDQPWVGTDPVPARTNAAATSCDSSSFSGTFDGAAWQRSSTRTFLLPEADLPTEFGLTETVGSLPLAQAEGFVDRVRDRLDTCSDDLGTDITRIGGSSGEGTSLDAWQLTAEVSDDRSIRFFMAVVRQGTSVAQVGFVPAGDVAMPDGAFVELAERARVRLEELPAYPTAGGGPDGGGTAGGGTAGTGPGGRS